MNSNPNLFSCSKCNKPLEGFCPTCGMSKIKSRATFLNLFVDFFISFFSFQKSSFGTLKTIFNHPNRIVNYYYEGYRNYYASPGKLLLLTVLLVTLNKLLFDENVLLGITFNVNLGEGFSVFTGKNLGVEYGFMFMNLLLFSLVSSIVYSFQKTPFIKQFISLIYVSSLFLFVSVIITWVLQWVLKIDLNIYPYIVYLILVFFWHSRALNNNKPIKYIVFNFILMILCFSGILFLIVLKTKNLNM